MALKTKPTWSTGSLYLGEDLHGVAQLPHARVNGGVGGQQLSVVQALRDARGQERREEEERGERRGEKMREERRGNERGEERGEENMMSSKPDTQCETNDYSNLLQENSLIKPCTGTTAPMS